MPELLIIILISLAILGYYLIALVPYCWMDRDSEEILPDLLKGLFALIVLPLFLVLSPWIIKMYLKDIENKKNSEAQKLLNLEVEELTNEINDCISSWEETLESYLLVSSLFSKVLRFEDKHRITALAELKEKLSDLTIKFENR